MKRLLVLLLSTVFFNCYGQSASVQVLQDQTVNMLRDFRDTVSRLPRTSTTDSLRDHITTLINVSKTLNDVEQLKNLKDYYSTALKNYSSASGVKKMTVVRNFNNDLNLKMTQTNGGNLPLENTNSLFQDYNVNIAVSINGSKQTNGQYTVFWAQFTGVDQKSIISSGYSNGNSLRFSNPYRLTIKLPGYITFWVKDTTTGVIFKSNPDHLKLNGGNQDIDVNFIPFY